MENNPSEKEQVSAATAVLLGALAPGVNGQTWNTLKIAFLMLGLCLTAMLSLAFSASDSTLIIHVTLLVFITGTLFFLLTRVISLGVCTQMEIHCSNVLTMATVAGEVQTSTQNQTAGSSQQTLAGNPQHNVIHAHVIGGYLSLTNFVGQPPGSVACSFQD
ncbi:hypothetical protein AgCh_020370 [Apium graveolens]